MRNTTGTNNKYWNDYSSYIKSLFGKRVQKISVNAGLTCPNKDGKISYSSCIYCNNKSFSPYYCKAEIPIKEQLKTGIDFFGKKYKSQKYLAYFQSGTNTYANIQTLKKMYSEALDVDNIIGLVIATRPDCLNEDIIKLLKEISEKYYLCVELGIESCSDKTLSLIKRGHSWADSVNAINTLSVNNIKIGTHLILGLPGENENDFYKHAIELSKLPINLIKIHQLQVLKDTALAEMYEKQSEIFFDFSDYNKYAEIAVKFAEHLNPEIVIERFTSESPKDSIIAPNWHGKKNFEISHIIQKKFYEKNTYQGKLYNQDLAK